MKGHEPYKAVGKKGLLDPGLKCQEPTAFSANGLCKGKGIIESGLDFNLSENDILEWLQKKLDISLQKAQEYFNMFGRQSCNIR